MWSRKDHSAWNLANYYRKRQYYIDYLGGCCVDCGSTEDLQFDHADPAAKSFTIGNYVTHSAEKVEAELAKCVLRCKRCHLEKSKINKELGGGQNKLPEEAFQHGTMRMYVTKKCRCIPCRRAKTLYYKKILKIDEVISPEMIPVKRGRWRTG